MTDVDYDRIGWLGEQVGASASAVDTAVAGIAEPGLALSAFGVSNDAEACGRSYEEVLTDATLAVERLVAVLRDDVHRFAATVTEFQNGDENSAEAILTAGGRRLDVFTTHLESGGAGTEDVRARQANAFRDAVADSTGPTIATLDANASRGGRGAAADALDAFDDRLGYTDAGDIGDTYGTRRIDYVFTSPDLAVGSEPERVEATDSKLSDHDGIVVEVPTPRW